MRRTSRQSHITIAPLIALCAMLLAIISCGGGNKETLPPVDKSKTNANDSTALQTPIIPADTSAKVGWIIKPTVNARSGPSTTAQIIKKVSRGTEIKLIEKQDQWWKVSLDDTTTAFINESMLSLERPVDPWTQFRLGARLADSTLQVVVEVNKVKGTPTPSASLTVAKEFAAMPRDKQQLVAEAAFGYWKSCLQKSGYDLKGTYLVFIDQGGKELLTAAPNADKVSVEFIDHE